ncbi:MAG: Ada metal-binding domain-containing protein [Saprospiraceae bacterium]
MLKHSGLTNSDLWIKLYNKEITIGGNSKLKIYGLLQCKSGKRMKRENRIFFKSIAEAISSGFRPCGHCMRKDYLRYQIINKNSL